MDLQTRNALQRLDNRLQSDYIIIADDILRRHRRTFEQIVAYDEAAYSFIQDEQQRLTQHWQTIRRNHSSEFFAIAAAVAAVGQTAGERIQSTAGLTLHRNYFLTVNNIRAQLGPGRSAPRWDFLSQEVLQSRIRESAFTKVAFQRLGFNSQAAQQHIMQRLQSRLFASVMAQEGADGLVTRIRTLTRSSYYDACRIARTEILRCANQGRYEAAQQAYRQYGIVTRKFWVHTDTAEEPRDDHRAMDGVEADDDGRFTLPNGERPLYPLDTVLSAEQSIHCSCTHIYKVVV